MEVLTKIGQKLIEASQKLAVLEAVFVEMAAVLAEENRKECHYMNEDPAQITSKPFDLLRALNALIKEKGDSVSYAFRRVEEEKSIQAFLLQKLFPEEESSDFERGYDQTVDHYKNWIEAQIKEVKPKGLEWKPIRELEQAHRQIWITDGIEDPILVWAMGKDAYGANIYQFVDGGRGSYVEAKFFMETPTNP